MKRFSTIQKCTSPILVALITLSVSVLPSWAGDLTVTNTFSNGTVADADQVNQNFTDVKSAVDDNNARVNENKVAIATNKAGIAANIPTITANTGKINSNTTAIVVNKTDIGTNAANITGNTGNISLNATDIQTNFTAIGINANDISKNTNARTSSWTLSGTNLNYGAGNVGIGTGTPGSSLHISSVPGRVDPITTAGGIFQCPSGTTWMDDKQANGGIDLGECQENGLVVEQGNVGIGLTNPVGKLQTQDTRFDEGTGNCPQGYTEGDFDGEGDLADCRAIGVTVLANGNVGIGTTTPKAKLVVQDGVFIISDSKHLGGSTAPFTYLNGKLTIGMDSSGTDGIAFKTYSSGYAERVVIKANGNVGIGTTTPGAKLDVKGNLNVSGIIRGASWGFGGVYTDVDSPCNNQNGDRVNPLTGGLNCPPGFTAYVFGRILSDASGRLCGANQFVCIR